VTMIPITVTNGLMELGMTFTECPTAHSHDSAASRTYQNPSVHWNFRPPLAVSPNCLAFQGYPHGTPCVTDHIGGRFPWLEQTLSLRAPSVQPNWRTLGEGSENSRQEVFA
jgi:hypothetical protein